MRITGYSFFGGIALATDSIIAGRSVGNSDDPLQTCADLATAWANETTTSRSSAAPIGRIASSYEGEISLPDRETFMLSDVYMPASLAPYSEWNEEEEIEEEEDEDLLMSKKEKKKFYKTIVRSTRVAKKKKKGKFKEPEEQEERVVGGLNAVRDRWTWIVRFPKLGCSGSIIASNWVLTAAHCCQGPNPNAYETIINDYDQFLNNEADISSHYPSQILKHLDFATSPTGTLENDLCLLRYEANAFDLDNSRAAAICLPDQDEALPNATSCFVAGWGLTDPDDSTSFSGILQEATIDLFEDEYCNNSTRYNNTMHSSSFCAGNTAGGIDTCQGDSGGPLVCLEDGSPKLFGITSYGEGCGDKDKPGVYAEIASARSWIDSMISGDWATNANYTDQTTTISCGDDFVGYEGSIEIGSDFRDNSTGFYNPNLQCTWTITVPEGSLVELSFDVFDVEEDDECIFDRVQILDGIHKKWIGSGTDSNSNGRALRHDEDYDNWVDEDEDFVIAGALCGNETRALPYQSLGNSMTVIFTSDLSDAGLGFNATWKVVDTDLKQDDNCGVSVADGASGSFPSPTGPMKPGQPIVYPSNADCQWTINVGELSEGQVVQVWFDEDFQLEKSDNCEYDSVKITAEDESGMSDSTEDRVLCGNKPGILTFTKEILKIQFTTDGRTEFSGFRLNWVVKDTMFDLTDVTLGMSWTVFTRPRTYLEAEADCDGIGKQLAKIDSDVQRKALMTELARANINGDFYLGLQRSTQIPTIFHWADAQPITGKYYTNWHSGEPQKPSAELLNCVYFGTAGSKGYQAGKWITANCEEQRSYVCGRKTTATKDCEEDELPENTGLIVQSCRGNLPGYRGSSCLIGCAEGMFLRPTIPGGKLPKKIKATCKPLSKKIPDSFRWSLKGLGTFTCSADCPFAFPQPKGMVQFIERAIDNSTMTSDSALLVRFQYPMKLPSNGWSVVLNFTRNITMANFSSEIAEIVKQDISSSRVVLTNKSFNSNPVGPRIRGFSFILRVSQPMNDLQYPDVILDELDPAQNADPINLEEHMISTQFIEGHVTSSLNMTCID